MKLNEMIERLEHGLWRSEDKSWVAFAINADEDAEDLLEELKLAKKALDLYSYEVQR